jgi:hypothetical protein
LLNFIPNSIIPCLAASLNVALSVFYIIRASLFGLLYMKRINASGKIPMILSDAFIITYK